MSLLCPSCATSLDPELSRLGHGLHPGCDPLPLTPEQVSIELTTAIAAAITGQPRSQQKRIGPSEIGIPCDRRIAHKLAGTPESNRTDDVAWKPYVGTALHEQFANIMAALELDNLASGMGTRWHVEEKVSPGLVVNDTDIDGSCDLYDGWSGTAFDWKFTTRNKIRETYKPHGPGEEYRVQAQEYGAGWARRGFPVRHVAVFFWTRDGDFHDRHLWHEPFNQGVVDAAHERINEIEAAVKAYGPKVLPTGDSYCTFCPYFKRGAVDLDRACPGHPKPEATSITTIATAPRQAPIPTLNTN